MVEILNEDLQDAPEYAGFWRRMGAYSIDMHIIIAVQILMLVVMFKFGLIEIGGATTWLLNIPFILFAALYFILQEGGKTSASFGKRCSGIKVVTKDLQPIAYNIAAIRFFAAILNHITFYIGYVMIGFTKDKTGLHDLIADTRVIVVGKGQFWKNYILSLFLVIGACFVVYNMVIAEIISQI